MARPDGFPKHERPWRAALPSGAFRYALQLLVEWIALATLLKVLLVT
jgi:hypothetical protein